MIYKFSLFVVSLIIASLSFNLAANENSVEIRVATAANFYHTLKKITDSYQAITKNKVTVIRGSSGKLYAQIVNGAPYDIFFSADSSRIDKLVKLKKTYDLEINKASFVYAIGKLALWVPDAQSSQELRELLNSGKFNKLAIANPKTAPYGKASIEALKSMELYEQVKDKLVYGENISQTLQFVQSGAADIGLVARSHVVDDIYWEIDSYLHKAINQKAALLNQSNQIEVAKEFLQYVQSPAIRRIIMLDGYDIPASIN